MREAAIQLFEKTFGAPPERLAFAPGRIEFIGNHTDYNGGLVMGTAVSEGITVAVRRLSDGAVRLVSGAGDRVETDLDGMTRREGKASWSNYPIGVATVMRAAGMKMETGFELAVAADLPSGAGLSSSAAFELATARALAEIYGFDADTAEFARLARQAENEFVGVPCGILDQGVSAFGRGDHLVRIDCREESFTLIPLPPRVHFWIFNSNNKHSLVDSCYAERHNQCLAARDILRKRFPDIRDLADCSEDQVRSLADELGDVLFRRALHVVTENARVREVEAALAASDLRAVGRALLASHESSRDNFENSIAELDFLVERLRDQPGVHGARLTGGGFGGAVMAFTGPEFTKAHAREVETAFNANFSRHATIFHTRSGDGARLL